MAALLALPMPVYATVAETAITKWAQRYKHIQHINNQNDEGESKDTDDIKENGNNKHLSGNSWRELLTAVGMSDDKTSKQSVKGKKGRKGNSSGNSNKLSPCHAALLDLADDELAAIAAGTARVTNALLQHPEPCVVAVAEVLAASSFATAGSNSGGRSGVVY